MPRKKKDQGKSTKIGIYFFAFIFGVISISLFLKGFLILRNSRFQDDSRFNFLITNARKSEVVSFLPQKHSVSVLKVEGNAKNIYKFLEVPVDGEIKSNSLDLDKPTSEVLSSIFFHFKDIKTNLTVLDRFRILLFSKTTTPGSFAERSVSTKLDEASLDKISLILFSDPKISDENLSVEIINASQEFGVGNRCARLITNTGGNVVLVSTSQNQEEKSVILYKGKKSYTTKRLGKLLGFEVLENKNQSLADITIQIGKDYKNFSNF